MPGSHSPHKSPTSVEITISNQTVVRVLLMVILSFLFLAALRRAAQALQLIVTGVFLAIVLNKPVHWFAVRLPGKKKGNRVLATALSFLVIILFLAGFLASIVPPLVLQTSNFIEAAPQLIDDTRTANNSIGQFIRNYNLEPQVERLAGQLGQRSDNIAGSALNVLTRAGSSFFAMLTILVIAFMTLIEGQKWLALLKGFIPAHKRKHAEGVIHDMYKVITGYVNGQVLLAALAASIMVVPLFAFNISYPVALMVIVFFCGLIPMIGHYIGVTILTLVALFTSVGSAIGILAFYVVYQQVENYAVQPRIQAASTNMTPLMVFVALIIGVSFGGLAGGLFAIPVAGCLKVLLVDYLVVKHKMPQILPVKE